MKRLRLFVLFNLLSMSAFAQNSWYVSENGSDASGDGSQSLPWATITNALSESTTVNGDTIHILGVITEEGVDILKEIIITGESKETSIVQANEDTFSATNRVFTNWSIVKIMNLTIRNGYFDSFSLQYGAGILNWGTLILENCIISDNSIENTELGGGIYNEFGTLYLKDTYVASNYSAYGGAGIVTEGGSLNIENSTIALNYTQQNLAKGAGILITDTADVNIINSTIYYNLMGFNSYGAGICIVGDDTYEGTIGLNLLNVTIADNEAGDGSFGNGIYIENNSTNPVELAIKNCIISNTESENYGEEGANITVLRTHTLCRDATLTGGGLSGNIDNVNPEIETFENHGGNTPTASLLETSPAINTGTDGGAPETDQRGFPREGITDMGAYEYQAGVSINKFDENTNVHVYPNPAKGYVTINLGNIDNLANAKLEIVDVFGRLIWESSNISTSSMKINFSNFKTGTYFIEVTTNNKTFTKKLIVR